MGSRVDYLERHPRTGRLSYRRIYPVNLRPHIAGNHRELKVSLGVAAITAPGASDKFNAAALLYAANVARARRIASKTFDRLDSDLIARLADTYRARELTADDNATWGELVDRGYTRRPSPEDDWRECRLMLEEDDREGLKQYWTEWAPGFAASLGYVIDTDGTPFARFSYAMAEAACDIWLTIDARREKVDRLDGRPTRTPPEPPAPIATPQLTTAPSATFEAIAESILGNPRHAVGISTKQSSRTSLRFLREAHGPIIPAAVTRVAITEFLDLLAQRPAALPLKERNLPLRELASLYTDRPQVPRLSQKTLAGHMGQLAALWRKAQSDGLILETLPDPFNKRTAVPQRRLEDPQELSPAELATIFALPVFTRGERPRGGRGEASYWLPLMLLWTGARPEELAQLMVSDVTQDADTGRWLMRITDEGSHPVKGQRSLKTSKKLSGRRTFPVPQVLLDLGFIDYVEWLKDRKAAALFPKLTLKNARRHLFPGWGEWWGLYLKANKAFPSGDKRRQAREFRHNWTTAARTSGIDREAREFIQGHTARGGSANEGYGSKTPLGLAIERFTYTDLDLSGVKRWAAPKA
jgi:integrase